ncbi:MAG: putative DNA-binding domain-containing protein [Brevundimonas sp.]
MSEFHDAFHRALDGAPEGLSPWLTLDDRGLAGLTVYRNTAARGRIEALAANYPVVAAMVGEDWFAGAARAFMRAHPDPDPVLATYGEGFPGFLATFPPARELPYLAPAARLDRAWTEAHLAPDHGPGPLHPSARLFRFDWSAPALWLAHRYPDQPGAAMRWAPGTQSMLIHRPRAEVRARLLTDAAWTVLDSVRRGLTSGAVMARVLMDHPGQDYVALMAGLTASGALQSSQEPNP